MVQPGELDTDPAGAAAVLAFAALQTVEAALSDYRSNALERLGRTEEAEAEVRRAYKTEQGRRWFRHNPNGADAIAAATKAANTARERAAEYLLTTRLKQLRADRRPDRAGPGRAVDGPAARTRRPPAAHRHGWGSDHMPTESKLSGVDSPARSCSRPGKRRGRAVTPGRSRSGAPPPPYGATTVSRWDWAARSA
ncbi:hypothetical protein AB0G82_37345 [Streptomyces anulatus]|uniref:hypothetical protein n=1 Tax=Streptomyces anulatus TaxID=1892 RepID=UPI0033DC0FA5